MGQCCENTKFSCSVLSHFWNKFGGKKCFYGVWKENIGHKLVNAVKIRSLTVVYFPIFEIYFDIKNLFRKHKMGKLTRNGLKSLEGLMAVARKSLKPLHEKFPNTENYHKKTTISGHFSHSEPSKFD